MMLVVIPSPVARHVDTDAFYASIEHSDKPNKRQRYPDSLGFSALILSMLNIRHRFSVLRGRMLHCHRCRFRALRFAIPNGCSIGCEISSGFAKVDSGKAISAAVLRDGDRF